MDQFKTFMEIFERAVAERNSDCLTEILKNSRTYFQNILKSESESVLSILFDEAKGLLSFLNNELKKPVPQKGFDTAIKEAFHLLTFIMEQFTDIFEPYITETKNTCQLAVTTKCSAYIQKAACITFNRLIELFKEYEIELDETIKKFVNLFQIVDIKERSLLFSVLGTIAKHTPEVPEVHEYSDMIFQQLRSDFKQQYIPRCQSHPEVFQTYFDVLSNILEELLSDTKERYCKELYEWIKDISNSGKYASKKASMRSAITLLFSHVQHFCTLVYRDYEFWYDLLTNLVQDKNQQCNECGQYALEKFYEVVASMLQQKTSENDKKVFLYFKNHFEESLKTNYHGNLSTLRFIVYGFSRMARPCKRYLTDNDVRNMFSLVAHCALPLCSREDLEQAILQNIRNYQEALSEIILHISNLSIDQINVILKLSILLVKRFPDLPITSQNRVISSLINTIINIGISNKNLLEEFLYNLIHDGIAWSCSHTLLVDAELQRELRRLEELPTTYKNYLPLWSRLLKPSRYKEHRQIVQEVVDTMIHVCIASINKLNMNTKTKEDSVLSDVAFSQIAENPEDFRTFINMTDLYVDIIDELESSLFTNVMPKFLVTIISISLKRPLISGFYKLVRSSFKHICNLAKNEIETEILKVLCKYLMNVLNLIPTFSSELLTTCLYLILNIPILHMEWILNSTIPAFKIAFTVGLSDFELACAALNTLEQWTSHLENRRTREFLREVVPYLESYLQSGESSVELLQDIVKKKPKVIKRIILRDDENTLDSFQMRVLLFIASLETDIIMHFVFKRSMDTGATWDKKDLLEYSLAFQDSKADVYFDKILPRLIVLAQNSGDRQTKITACEVLHSIIAFVLGETSKHLMDLDNYVPVYKILCPALLNLGCDYDQTTKDLFQPLMLQLTHWLSSEFMQKSQIPVYFLDLLFTGLSNDSNSSLREFSGACLAEFTKWSMKQSGRHRETQLNIDDIIYRITNFALHPSVSKRVAAAIAFNHLYTILREDEEIVTIYWLEIFYCFVKSLNGCNDPSIFMALNHVERVLLAKEELLNVNHDNRRKPYEFEAATLTHATNWLLTQCGCIDECCRAKCMELVVKLAPHIKNCNSAERMINNYIQVHGIKSFSYIILKDLKLKMDSLSSNDILPLLRSFDCCIWLIRQNLLNAQCLFGSSNAEREAIFNCANNFVHLVNKIKMEEKDDDLMMLPREFEDLQTQCKAVMIMFDFLHMLLNFDESFVPDFFFNTDLFELISKCIMCPQVLEFNSKNLELTETLPLIMGNLLESMMQKTDDSRLNPLKRELSIRVEEHMNEFIDLDTIVSSGNYCSKLEQYVRGLCFLEQHNMLNQLHNGKQLIDQPEDTVTRIFNVLAKERIGELVRVDIKPSVKEYLRSLMELLLTRYEPSMVRTLIKLIENNTMLGPDPQKIEHGIHFLNTFKNVLFRYLLKDTEKTMQVLDFLQGNPSFLLTIAELLFLFVQRHKKELQDRNETLVDAIVERFPMFERAVNNLEDRRQKLISIYGIAVHLKCEPTKLLSVSENFYAWILNQLTQNSDLDQKIQILRNFLVCLTDMTSNVTPGLLAIFRGLRSYRHASSTDDSPETNLRALKASNCFQTLLSLLPVTKSLLVFEAIMFFAAGAAEHLCNEQTNEYIKKYFHSITTEYALKSIEVAYKLFMDLNTTINERLDVLRKFLLPVFQFCETTEIRHFFERNIKQIYAIVCQSLIGTSSDVQQLIVSKIGCYDLVAIMFAKIPLKEIADSESVITRNAINDVVTGRELLQGLYTNALSVRMLKSPELEHKELMRSLHCSAYNCSIAIVCLKKDEDSYVSIFAENRKKGQLIWENILDCDKRYQFSQTFSKLPQIRSKLINIRKSTKKKKHSSRYSYIYSYDLSACTLYEDINAYDLNEAFVRERYSKADREENMSLLFDCDEINNHECMASICGALNHMVSEEISVLPADDDLTMPKWLKCFCNSMTTACQNNVLLFMLKIVWNMQTVFKHYAKLVLSPIISATYTYLKKNQLNYIIIEIIIMLIDWHMVVLPVENDSKLMAQKLWEIIIRKVLMGKNHVSRVVYDYNMSIIKRMLEAWRACLKLPENLGDKMRTAPDGAIYVILICFENGMENDIVQRNDILEFLEESLKNWQNDEKTVLQCCECIGYTLKSLNEDHQLSNRKCAMIDKIRSVVQQMQKTFRGRQMKCIRAVCNHYPAADMISFEFVTANMHSLDPEGKKNCLEIFLLCIPNLSVDQILKELGYLKFHDLLTNKVLLCELIALRIIDSLVSILPPSNILSLVNLVPPYTKHETSEYREYAYSIFMSVHKRYAADSAAYAKDKKVRELMRISKEMLLNGVLDPSEELQEKVFTFWSQSARFTNTCKERLLEILDMYTPASGNNFLPFMLLMLLDLTRKSGEYTEKMYKPLHHGAYRNYNVSVSWRTRNLGSKAPLFVSTLASQMHPTFTQMSVALPSTSSDSTLARTSISDASGLRIRETREPEFEPTFIDKHPTDSMVDDVEDEVAFEVPEMPQPAYNKKSKRFLSNSSDVSANIRQQKIKKNIRRHEMIKEETARQRSSAKLYRSYRIGDFPDIEITHAMLIEPMQQLAKRDQLICKDLTVSIVCSLLKKCKSNDFPEKLSNSLKHIIESQQESSSTATAILEIQLFTRITNCSPEAIAKVSRSNGLNFLGSLVLEERLIYGTNCTEPPEKRIRNEGAIDSSNEWLQLTNLYESLNDVDVVLSIFQNHITDVNMREASFAQAANNWTVAKAAYEKAYETESEVVKEHCLHGLFECLSNLCCWTEIEKHVENRLNGDIHNIWKDPWKDWMFPWLFEGMVRRLVDEDINDTFKENVTVKMQSWVEDDAKQMQLKRLFGEELSMLFLLCPGKQVGAREFLMSTLDDVREQWVRLHPLSTQLRIRKLQKLRVMNDVNLFIKTLKAADAPSDLQGILKFWNNSLPSAQDAILPWDKLITYRTCFIESQISPLNDKLNEWSAMEEDSESVPDREETRITHKLHTAAFTLRSKLIEAALNQKNKCVAKKYLLQLERNLDNYSPVMKHQLLLSAANIKYLYGEIETTVSSKLKNYVSSWKKCHNLLRTDELDTAMIVHTRLQISRLASRIARFSEEDETFSELLAKNDVILNEIHAENENLPGIRNSLEAYSLNHLKTCCDTTTANIKECYITLSKYCYDRLSRGEDDVLLSKEFVHSTLKAMRYESLEAAHYFPCLLKPEYFENEETKRIFMEESEKIETWLFLSWQAQLFSHLGTAIAPLIIPILERVVKTYPNAVIYTFRLTVETNPALLNEARTYKIRQVLYQNPAIDKFLLAMQYVVQPELYLQYYLLEFLKNLSLGTSTALSMLLEKLYPSRRLNMHNPKPGSIFNELEKYKNEIKQLERKKPEEIKQRVAHIISRVKKSLQKRKRDRVQLKEYSPWLHEFSARDIEIPGQYTGNRKPMPQYHTKIMKFEPIVKVMHSLRKPIRITMIGNDAKEYHFLVKFGEDLRQDQRLQQLFTIMNKTLHIDAVCRQRQLSIDTYQVVPMSRTVGLIQWIDDTRSLADLIYFTLSEQETKRYNSIAEKYENWMHHAGSYKRSYEVYKEATMKYNASRVIAKMNEFIGYTEWDSLRRTFVTLCPSVESFVAMRRNFVTTYATMCTVHWILGIGDRHLGNTLITVGSGRCLGIDFGVCFDAGIDLKIPELVPFRLTPQILGLLKPFTEKDLLGTIMIHTLRALRNEQGPILSCMDVFVHEPLNWTEHVNKELRENEEDIMDVKWVPMKKIKAVTKKLNGIKPSLITLEQLKEQHNDKYFERYYAIVTGDDDIKSTRAGMKNDSLTPEEQVECLLDQATDLNILGRTYVGWKPWL